MCSINSDVLDIVSDFIAENHNNFCDFCDAERVDPAATISKLNELILRLRHQEDKS